MAQKQTKLIFQKITPEQHHEQALRENARIAAIVEGQRAAAAKKAAADADAAAAKPRLKPGPKPKPLADLQLDVASVVSVRNKSLEWLLDAHSHLCTMSESIIAAFKRVGVLKAWDKKYQLQALTQQQRLFPRASPGDVGDATCSTRELQRSEREAAAVAGLQEDAAEEDWQDTVPLPVLVAHLLAHPAGGQAPPPHPTEDAGTGLMVDPPANAVVDKNAHYFKAAIAAAAKYDQLAPAEVVRLTTKVSKRKPPARTAPVGATSTQPAPKKQRVRGAKGKAALRMAGTNEKKRRALQAGSRRGKRQALEAAVTRGKAVAAAGGQAVAAASEDSDEQPVDSGSGREESEEYSGSGEESEEWGEGESEEEGEGESEEESEEEGEGKD